MLEEARNKVVKTTKAGINNWDAQARGVEAVAWELLSFLAWVANR